jgi:hypothetical protein
MSRHSISHGKQSRQAKSGSELFGRDPAGTSLMACKAPERRLAKLGPLGLAPWHFAGKNAGIQPDEMFYVGMGGKSPG